MSDGPRRATLERHERGSDEGDGRRRWQRWRRCCALHELAGDRMDLELLRSSARVRVSAARGGRAVRPRRGHRFDLPHFAHDQAPCLHIAGIDAVDPGAHRLVTWDGRSFSYDPAPASRSAPAPTARSRAASRSRAPATRAASAPSCASSRSGAFAASPSRCPPGASWPLPLYELALMTAAHVAERGLRKVRAPARHARARAARAVRRRRRPRRCAICSSERGIELHTSAYPIEAAGGELVTVPGRAAGRRPRGEPARAWSGPRLPGLPHDPRRLYPRRPPRPVRGEQDVYAAGDATDLARSSRAAWPRSRPTRPPRPSPRAPARRLDPQPFRPVLRGLLLTGGSRATCAPRYRRPRRGLARLGARALVAAEQDRRPAARALPRAQARGARAPAGGVDVEVD